MGYVPRPPPPPTDPHQHSPSHRPQFPPNTDQFGGPLPTPGIRAPEMFGDSQVITAYPAWLRRIGMWFQRHRSWFFNIPSPLAPTPQGGQSGQGIPCYVIEEPTYDFENSPPPANVWREDLVSPPKPHEKP